MSHIVFITPPLGQDCCVEKFITSRAKYLADVKGCTVSLVTATHASKQAVQALHPDIVVTTLPDDLPFLCDLTGCKIVCEIFEGVANSLSHPYLQCFDRVIHLDACVAESEWSDYFDIIYNCYLNS